MSEVAQINFGGVSNEPNDYGHEEGDLSLALNAVYHFGSMRPVSGGKEKFQFVSTMKLMLIHEYNSTNNYIFLTDDNSLVYISEDDALSIYENGHPDAEDIDVYYKHYVLEADCTVIHTFTEEVRQVKNIRLVLVVSTGDGLRFVRYNGSEYTYLGALPKMPYVLPFIQTKTVAMQDLAPEMFENAVSTTVYFKDDSLGCDFRSEMYNFVTGEVKDLDLHGTLQTVMYNKFFEMINVMKKMIHREGNFTAPFFVRVAFKMFDGTYVSVSRPYAMCPTTSYNPLCIFTGFTSSDKLVASGEAEVIMPSSTLQLQINKIDDEWKDIITGIDIFVSPEVINYTDDAGSVKSMIAGSTGTMDQSMTSSLYDYYTNTATASTTTPSTTIVKKDVYTDLSSRPSTHVQFVSTKTLSSGNYISQVHTKTYKYVFLIPKTANSSIWSLSGDEVKPSTSGTYYDYVKEELGEEYLVNYDMYNPDIRGQYIYKGEDKTKVQIYKLFFTAVDNTISMAAIMELSRTDGISADEAFMTESKFYKLASIDFDEINDGDIYSPIVSEYYLDALATMPTLKDTSIRNYDYTSSDILTYNNRLNAVVEKQTIEAVDYTDTFLYGTKTPAIDVPSTTLYVEYVKDGTKYYTKSSKKFVDKGNYSFYFYYPSIFATNLHILEEKSNLITYTSLVGQSVTVDGTTYTISSASLTYYNNYYSKTLIEVPLKQHDTLSGAYVFNGFCGIDSLGNERSIGTEYKYYIFPESTLDSNVTFDTEPSDRAKAITAVRDLWISLVKEKLETVGYTGDIDETDGTHSVTVDPSTSYDKELVADLEACNGTFYVGNKILQSAVDNPFAMMTSGTNQLSCDGILKISASTKPISLGQFGDYPLYAFADNGIWALQTSDTGTYSSVSPVSQDVCVNADSVTQLDQTIQFVTERGLMLLDGGNVSCLSNTLEGHNYTDGISKLEDALVLASSTFSGITVNNHITEWLKQAQILYAYKTQKIYYFVKGDPLGYVYSTIDEKWGMFYADGLLYPIGGYDDALIVRQYDDDTHSLVDMANATISETASTASLIITRPLVFSSPDTYKTVEDIILRGVYDDVFKMIVWASNDNKTYWVIGSSTNARWRNVSGTPYKFYRVGVIANWKEKDMLNGMSVTYTDRMNNKIR